MTVINPSAEERKHHEACRKVGCVITRQHHPTIHHCHGGSMRSIGVDKGGGLRTSHWLVLPLAAELHCAGQYALDGSFGVARWEQMFGTQLWWLRWIDERLSYDVSIFERAGILMPRTTLLMANDPHTPKWPEN